MAAPRTINETGVGAGPYRPYRGPQYFADRKPVDKVGWVRFMRVLKELLLKTMQQRKGV